jgi:hypothetical protein
MKHASQLALGLLVALALQGVAMAQTATVITDKADYAPGTIVTITGSGWQPGETVTLSFVESPLIDTHPDLYATADANGNILNNQFSPDSHDADITFTLTATGGSSGLQAQTVFTDATSLKSVSVGTQAPASIPPGSSATYTITVVFAGNGSCTVALSITTALPTGATASFSPNTLTGVASNPELTSTLTINTTGATPAATTSFTVQAKGTGGTGNDCTNADVQTATGSLVVSSPSVRRKGQTIIASLLPEERYSILMLQRSGL